MVFSAAGCAHIPVDHRPAASVWLAYGPLQDDPDPLNQTQEFLRVDGTYATISHHGGGDVTTAVSAVGMIPDSVMAKMRAIADLPEVKEYRGCGMIAGPDRLYEFQIKRSTFTQRILFTDACRKEFPGGLVRLFLAFQRGLAGAPPF